MAAQEYNQHLNKEIEKLRSVLSPSKRDLNTLFDGKTKDKRYSGHHFDYILSLEEKDIFNRTLVNVAKRRLEQLIPNDLRQFIDIPSQYHRIYFPLPSANYSFKGIPCLDIHFDIFASAYTEIWLKTVRKTFSGHNFNLPVMEGANGSKLLEKPEFIGYYYLVLTPEDLGGYIPWVSIPLILLSGLLNGETKPVGVTISAASDSTITYRIPQFKEEVTIPDSFVEYLRGIGTIEEIVARGIITERIASIVRSELGNQVALPSNNMQMRTSRKSKVFQLFSQGKRPSAPEVKALGIKPESAYRYYQQWKKTQNHL